MANTQAMCTSFKVELLGGFHCFNNTGGVRAADTFKAALYLAAGGTLGAATTAYSTTNEVSGSGYTAGGVAVTFGTNPSSPNGAAAVLTPSASIVYTGVTLATAFDSVLIYNSTQGNKAVSVHAFGSQTITAGTLTLTMPTNAVGTALIEID